MTNLLLMILNMQASAKKNKSKEILECLEINKSNKIVDIGSGGGYYSYKFANEVGESGQVYSIDIDERYLRYIRKGAKLRGINNIKTLLVQEEDGLFNIKEKIDLIFMRDVFHDISKPEIYFKNLNKIQDVGGKVAIIDYLDNKKTKESMTGHCSNENEIIKIMQRCGYKHYLKSNILRVQSFNIFIK